MPTYSLSYRQLDYVETGFLTSFLFIAAVAGVLISVVLLPHARERS